MTRQPPATGRFRVFRSRVRQTAVLLAAATATALVATLGVATSASAHNVLISTDPANGSTVATLPSTVTLTFNLPALAIGSVLVVTGPAGNIAVGPPTLIDHFVKQAVRPGSPAGAYLVEWRVTSIDGHPISGEFRFTAKAGNGSAGSGSATGPTAAATTQPGTAVGGTSSTPLPATTTTDSGSGGSATPLIVLLIVVVLAILAAGVYLALRRPGPARSDSDQTGSSGGSEDTDDPEDDDDSDETGA